jgi:hypothetical protein
MANDTALCELDTILIERDTVATTVFDPDTTLLASALILAILLERDNTEKAFLTLIIYL